MVAKDVHIWPGLGNEFDAMRGLAGHE